MSGVSGSDRITRDDFKKVLKNYTKVISKFPGFKSVVPSGSYNSDMSKNDFGDMDLIVTIKSDLDKKELKKKIADFFSEMPDNIIIPFNSEKYKGRKLYNSGEIITIQYPQGNGQTVQIDNIIAQDEAEAGFKSNFLDLPAQKQGLIIGLVKVILLEESPSKLFKIINFKPEKLTDKQEYAFNVSSVELQLRKVTYTDDFPNTYKEKKREIVWSSRDWSYITKLLHNFNLDLPFEDLIKDIKRKIKNPRSSRRINGLFQDMISIKSGEVGKDKGKVKQVALDAVKNTFSESHTPLHLRIFVESFKKINN